VCIRVRRRNLSEIAISVVAWLVNPIDELSNALAGPLPDYLSTDLSTLHAYIPISASLSP